MIAGNTYRHKEKNEKRESSFREYGEFHSYKPGLISIIAPCYNEEENVEHFLSAISEINVRPYRMEVTDYIVHTEENYLPGYNKTSIKNNCNQNTACRNINFLMDSNFEKAYHQEAESRHPP